VRRTPARTIEEADEIGRRAVFDQAGDEDAESLDVTPGARYGQDDDPGRADLWWVAVKSSWRGFATRGG
jgi:hypothetical protein